MVRFHWGNWRRKAPVRCVIPQVSTDENQLVPVLPGNHPREGSCVLAKGLAEADCYQSPVPRGEMRRLLERRNGPAIRDCVIWFALIVGSGIAGGVLWGTGWAIIPFFIYGTLYASTADSRWHEAGHGTAFKSDWLNNTLYEIASFMVMRESTVWRWSHTRHHSDAIIVGRDPEITVPRPPNLTAMILNLFHPPAYPRYFCQLFLHATGRMHVCRGKNIHSHERISQDIFQGPHPPCGLWRDHLDGRRFA